VLVQISAKGILTLLKKKRSIRKKLSDKSNISVPSDEEIRELSNCEDTCFAKISRAARDESMKFFVEAISDFTNRKSGPNATHSYSPYPNMAASVTKCKLTEDIWAFNDWYGFILTQNET
jgi:hypothetical protein